MSIINSFDREVALAGLEKEKQVLAQLKEIYRQALADVTKKIHISDGKIDTLLNEVDDLDEVTASEIQSQIYQKKFQENLKNQLDFLLDDVNEKQYPGIKDYLYSCYDDGFIGTLYSLNMQGVTVVAPIIPELVVRALYTDSKISTDLYESLGEKVDLLKKRISREIARGISSSMSYADIARNIANQSKFGVSNAMRIVRTEGNRIHNAARLDSAKTAKEKTGADLVKVWDSTIDKRTRKTHQKLDGQVKELDEDFVNSDGKKAQAPGQFGIPSEDIHCRCVSLIQPRSELAESFTKRNSETGELLEFQNVKDYGEFKERYWEWDKKEKKLLTNEKNRAILKEKIANGEISLKLNPEKQNPHIFGTKEYNPKNNKSYFNISIDYLQEILNNNYGTGNIRILVNNQIKETIEVQDSIAVVVDKNGNDLGETNRFTVHYSKKRTHIVPTKKEVKNGFE